MDTEVVHALRRWVIRGDLSAERAQRAIQALGDLARGAAGLVAVTDLSP